MTIVHNLILLNGNTSGRLGKFGLTSVNSSQDWYVELAEGDNLPRSVIDLQNNKCHLLACNTAGFSHYNLFKSSSGHRIISKVLQKTASPFNNKCLGGKKRMYYVLFFQFCVHSFQTIMLIRK